MIVTVNDLAKVHFFPSAAAGAEHRTPAAAWLEQKSVKHPWSGLELVATRNSVYGNLAVAVVQTEGTRARFENGLAAFHVPDPAAVIKAIFEASLSVIAIPEFLLRAQLTCPPAKSTERSVGAPHFVLVIWYQGSR
jgi:hypothetical protein